VYYQFIKRQLTVEEENETTKLSSIILFLNNKLWWYASEFHGIEKEDIHMSLNSFYPSLQWNDDLSGV
jgi:hypothetical protein